MVRPHSIKGSVHPNENIFSHLLLLVSSHVDTFGLVYPVVRISLRFLFPLDTGKWNFSCGDHSIEKFQRQWRELWKREVPITLKDTGNMNLIF